MHSKWDMISNRWLTYTYHVIFNLQDVKVLIYLQMDYVVSVLPHKMSSESNLDECHSDIRQHQVPKRNGDQVPARVL